MSKFFFKGREDIRENHTLSGYKEKGTKHTGTKKYPFELMVTSAARQAEIEALLLEHALFANITLDESAEENIVELTAALNKPVTTTFDKTPGRNDPCSCGSGKKYKKCCG